MGFHGFLQPLLLIADGLQDLRDLLNDLPAKEFALLCILDAVTGQGQQGELGKLLL